MLTERVAPATVLTQEELGASSAAKEALAFAILAHETILGRPSNVPSATGARAGVLTVYGNVAGGQAIAALTGIGAPAAAIVLSPITVTYTGTNVGSISVAQNITISNTGGVAATLGTPVVSGDFTITANTCGATLAANVGCTVAVVFKPTASGTRTGSLTVTEVYSLTAWLLVANRIIDSNQVMDAQRLPLVVMPAKKFFVPDDRRGGPEVR